MTATRTAPTAFEREALGRIDLEPQTAGELGAWLRNTGRMSTSGRVSSAWGGGEFLPCPSPPEGQRWAITSSYGVSYWATDDQAIAYADSRNAREGHVAVAVRLEALSPHDCVKGRWRVDAIVDAARWAVENGWRVVV